MICEKPTTVLSSLCNMRCFIAMEDFSDGFDVLNNSATVVLQTRSSFSIEFVIKHLSYCLLLIARRSLLMPLCILSVEFASLQPLAYYLGVLRCVSLVTIPFPFVFVAPIRVFFHSVLSMLVVKEDLEHLYQESLGQSTLLLYCVIRLFTASSTRVRIF